MTWTGELVIGFGGNVGDVLAGFRQVRGALSVLSPDDKIISAPLYRTAPIGPAQPPFLNTAVRLCWGESTPEFLIGILRDFERELGRDRTREERWGPRTIDLDVLVWGDRVLKMPDLEVPHPRIAERRFVLRPLIEVLDEDDVLPGMTESLGVLEKRVMGQEIEELSASW